MEASAQDPGFRALTYRRLARRNRIVGTLRWAVPALGVLVFVGLFAQIFLGQLAGRLGAAGVSIDRGMLVVDTPRFAGVLTTGAAYTLTADEARVAIDRPNLIALTGALVTV